MIWPLFLFFFKLLVSTRASTEALQDPKDCIVLCMSSSHVVFVT
jgi:hypothetical protein